MLRSLVAAVLLYACGHPGLDGYRPGVLDRPLQGLHREVNQVAAEGQRALALLDDARSMRYLKGYTSHMSSLLNGG